MEKLTNISSEQQLLQLRNEGKITEDKYKELLKTLRKTTMSGIEKGSQDKLKPARTSGLAIASLVLALAFGLGCIPAIIYGHLRLRKLEKDASLKGRGLALAGLIISYAVLGISILMILLFLLSYGHRIKTSPEVTEVTEIRRFPLDNMEGLLTQSGLQIDKRISSDGNGSLRIVATQPTTFRLFEAGDIDIENARLIYQAKVRTENIEGRAYLEMWCHFPGRGEFFSRGLVTPLGGTIDWTTEETPFFLKQGQNPDNVKLNLVIDGKGTAWIDDIRLLKGPLK